MTTTITTAVELDALRRGECTEDMGSDPCGRTAVAARVDPVHGDVYPVCTRHARTPDLMVALSTLLRPDAPAQPTPAPVDGDAAAGAGEADGPPDGWADGTLPIRVRDRWIAAVLAFIRDRGYEVTAPGSTPAPIDGDAVERAARVLWEDARQEYDYDWEPNADRFRDLARAALTAARAAGDGAAVDREALTEQIDGVLSRCQIDGVDPAPDLADLFARLATQGDAAVPSVTREQVERAARKAWEDERDEGYAGSWIANAETYRRIVRANVAALGIEVTQ